MAVSCTAVAPVLPSTHSTWSDCASHLLHLQQGNLFQVVLQLYKNQESGLIFFIYLFFPEACLFIYLLAILMTVHKDRQVSLFDSLSTAAEGTGNIFL